MNKLNQDGSGLAIGLILVSVLLVAALGFGGWAFSGRQDYKNNVDQKIAVAVDDAKKKQQSEDAVKYAEEAKNPLKTYTGPEQFGSVSVTYPKTWSSYVRTNSNLFNAYFHPDFVPTTDNQNNNFALQVEVVQQTYSSVLGGFNGQKEVAVKPYALPKVPKVVGVRVDGKISSNKTGSMIVLPLRGTTLKIYTQSDQFKADFDNIILPNISFVP